MGRLGGADKLALRDLYECKCPDCGGNTERVALSVTESNKLEKAFNKVARWMYSEKKTEIIAADLDNKHVQGLTKEINSVLQDAVQTGIKYEIPNAMLQHFKNNVYVFSGCKTFAQLRELSDLLLDDKGEVKPFGKYYKDVRQVHNTYNKAYLESEYLFATKSARAASYWVEIEKYGDEYNLQYRTAGDDKVRYVHQQIDLITLPPSDPFWSKYYPPNGWRCRCTATQVRKKSYPVSDSATANDLGEKATYTVGAGGKNTSEMFRFNPGKQQTIFPETHPYFNNKEAADKSREILSYEDKKRAFKFMKASEIDVRGQYWANAKKYDLTKVEAQSIHSYTRHSYFDINEALRDNKMTDNLNSYAKVLNSALDKMPKYEGVVFRGNSLSKEDLHKYINAVKEKKIITEDMFLSSSQSQKVAEGFGRCQFEIKSKSGRQIHEVSSFGEKEKEVLFKSGTQFKVTSFEPVDNNGTMYYTIRMEEL